MYISEKLSRIMHNTYTSKNIIAYRNFTLSAKATKICTEHILHKFRVKIL